MPLQSTSSALYDDNVFDEALLEELDRVGAQRALQLASTATPHVAVRNDASTSRKATLLPVISNVNKRSSIGSAEAEAEEYTFNPDLELEEAQQDEHQAYEGQEFYGAIKFGEFGKYMQNKRRKLGVQQMSRLQNADVEQTSETLKGLRIYINGETDPPAHVLSDLIIRHGGRYIPYLDQKTLATHIIASRLTPSKRIQFKDYKVVQAAWLLDSIRDSKVKDWRWYREDGTPAGVVDTELAIAGTQAAQPKLAFNRVKQDANGAKSTQTVQLPVSPPAVEGRTAMTTPIEGQLKAVLPIKISKPVSPAKLTTPRRLPPPTSDPVTLIHIEGNAAALEKEVRTPAYITEGWYSTTTNAKAAELMRDEQWRLGKTAVNTAEFLETYYRESRLHWLSTWKAELKKMVGELSEGKEIDIGDGRRKKPSLFGDERDKRIIMHCDFDSFFVAASLLARSHLKGLPVVVCHASTSDIGSSSEIASASYEARAFGVKNGMSLGAARKRCPNLHTVPYDFDLYRNISNKFYTILFSHARELEAVSIDEAYISLPASDALRTSRQLLTLAESIRAEIFSATGCQTSIGVSHNKLLARLATNRAKPSSTFQIGNGVDPSGKDIEEFLRNVDVETLPQIGWKRAGEVEIKLKELSKRLGKGHFAHKGENAITFSEDIAYDRVGHLRPFKKHQLREALGDKTGEMLFNYARGIDNRELETDNVRKSVSAEVNYGIRFRDEDEVEKFMHGLGGEVATRLINLKYKGRQLTLKVMRRAVNAPIEPPKFMGHGICDTVNASKLVELTNDAIYIGKTATDLMRSLKCPPEELRGIGLQMQKLESSANIGGALPTDGQSRLVFQAKDADNISAEPPGLIVAPADASILIEDSSSPRLLPSSANGNGGHNLRLRKSVSYVDIEEDPDDFELLSQAPAGFVNKPKPAQALLGGQLIKRSTARSVTPKPTIIPVTSPIQAATTTPAVKSPTKLTDKQLSLLGLDVNFFHSCSRDTQKEILKEVLYKRTDDKDVQRVLVLARKGKKGKKAKPLFAPVFEEAAANAAKREAAKKRQQEKAERNARGPVLLKLDFEGRLREPMFAGETDTAKIRNLLSDWMEGIGIDHGPALEEVDEFAKYCLAVISDRTGSGGDVERVAVLLTWWKLLIEERSQGAVSSGSQRQAARAWSDAWSEVFSRVNVQVRSLWHAPLRIL